MVHNIMKVTLLFATFFITSAFIWLVIVKVNFHYPVRITIEFYLL